MGARTGHGAGAKQPVCIEVLPVDELPAGIPAPARAESPTDRGEAGRFAPGNGLASVGGKARQGKTRLAGRTSLAAMPSTAPFAPYRAAVVSFRRSACADLARTVGGGSLGPLPSSIVASAALQLGWSRYWSDLAATTGDAQHALTASRLADASRQNLLAATELAAREAAARFHGHDPIADLARRLDAMPKATT